MDSYRCHTYVVESYVLIGKYTRSAKQSCPPVTEVCLHKGGIITLCQLLMSTEMLSKHLLTSKLEYILKILLVYKKKSAT